MDTNHIILSTEPTLRRVLVVAYYFPPMGLSGVQRVAKFVKYLPDYGWLPTVLTVEPHGYFAYDPPLWEELVRAGVEVRRTTSFDPTRLFGKKQTVALPDETTRRRLSGLSQWLFVPDNKIGWYGPAVRAGRQVLRVERYHAVFSSAPPYTAHLVAKSLSRAARLPLVTDFRDDWLGNPRHTYPTPLHRRLHARLEREVLRASDRVVAINRHIAEGLRRRHPGVLPDDAVHVIPQGFDPEDFLVPPAPRPQGKMRLLYAGVFYDAQKPDFFLRGLHEFITRRPEARAMVEALFVGLLPAAAVELVEDLGMADLVTGAGYLPHRETVAHLRAADVLWMTIGDRPGAEGISTGKLFEYLGAGKPILALIPDGMAREALEPCGAATIVPPADVPAISRALETLFDRWRMGALPRPDPAYVEGFDRRILAGALAASLNACVDTGPQE